MFTHSPDITLQPQRCTLYCVLSVFCFLCTKLCHILSQKQLSKKITLLDFIPSSYLASPCWLSSITACTVWSLSPGDEVHLSSSTNQSKKQRRQPISFSAAKQEKKNQLSGAARSATSLQNEYFLISLPGMAPGPRTMLMDDVLMLLNVIFTEQGKL